MLRSDTAVLFERLRESQQPPSGSSRRRQHQSRLKIEQVLSTRVADFVGTMNNLLKRPTAPRPRWTTISGLLRSHRRCSKISAISPRTSTSTAASWAMRQPCSATPTAKPSPLSPTGAGFWKILFRRSTPAPRISICGSSASAACSMNRSPAAVPKPRARHRPHDRGRQQHRHTDHHRAVPVGA